MTQNYVSTANLSHVMRFLAKGSVELVSGCSVAARGDLHARFLSALEQQRPDVVQRLREAENAARHAASAAQRLSSLFGLPVQPRHGKRQRPSDTLHAGCSDLQMKRHAGLKVVEQSVDQHRFCFGFSSA